MFPPQAAAPLWLQVSCSACWLRSVLIWHLKIRRMSGFHSVSKFSLLKCDSSTAAFTNTWQQLCPLLLRKCRHLGNAGRGDGTEVSQLVEVHASWFNDFSEVIHTLYCSCDILIYSFLCFAFTVSWHEWFFFSVCWCWWRSSLGCWRDHINYHKKMWHFCVSVHIYDQKNSTFSQMMIHTWCFFY